MAAPCNGPASHVKRVISTPSGTPTRDRQAYGDQYQQQVLEGETEDLGTSRDGKAR